MSTGRVIRILTSVFPRYFAVITRVREQVRSVGPDGGKVVLPQDPRLRATFPKNALYKKIKVHTYNTIHKHNKKVKVFNFLSSGRAPGAVSPA